MPNPQTIARFLALHSSLIALAIFAIAFALSAILTLYATFPILWRDPLALADAFPTLANHPALIPTLFRGEWVKCPDIPWDFIPVWMLITTPPVALALAALGVLAVAWLCAARWRDALANPDARFGLLALACPSPPSSPSRPTSTTTGG